MKKNRILFAGERKGRIFTPVITTTNTTKMYTVTLIRREGRKAIKNQVYPTLEQAQRAAAKFDKMLGSSWGARAEAL
jgi:hypothetical protein